MNIIEMKGNLGGFTLLKGRVPEGHCPECIVKHDPSDPHNWQSMHYQMAFKEQHGRFPTWHDAMRHCDAKMKALWLDALAAHGVIVGEDPGDPAKQPKRVRCISLWQPWASLMFADKYLETRSWDTQVRGTVFIHAAKTMKGIEIMAQSKHLKAIEESLGIPHAEWKTKLPFGKLIGSGKLHHTMDSEEAARECPDQIPFGDFTPGRFAHFYSELMPLQSLVPCKGKQGFFFAEIYKTDGIGNYITPVEVLG